MTSSYRARRLFWWWRASRQHNPLLRRSTPAQRVAVAAALIVVLTVAVGGVFAVLTTHASAAADARRDATGSHPVAATVRAVDAPADTVPDMDGTGTTHTVRLSWSWHGREHTGTRQVLSPPDVGSTTTAWVDDTGALAPRPWTGADLTLVVTGVALGAALIEAIVVLSVVRLFQAWNLRRRAESWSAEWAAVASSWSRDHGFR
jgi:hypothetical protein